MKELSYKKIVEKFKDLAGKTRVLVEISDGELIMLKFQENPTDKKVKEETEKRIEKIKEEELKTKEIIK